MPLKIRRITPYTHKRTGTWSTISPLNIFNLVRIQCSSDYGVAQSYPLLSLSRSFIRSFTPQILLSTICQTPASKSWKHQKTFYVSGIHKMTWRFWFFLQATSCLNHFRKRSALSQPMFRNPIQERNLCVGSLQWQFSKLPCIRITRELVFKKNIISSQQVWFSIWDGVQKSYFLTSISVILLLGAHRSCLEKYWSSA